MSASLDRSGKDPISARPDEAACSQLTLAVGMSRACVHWMQKRVERSRHRHPFDSTLHELQPRRHLIRGGRLLLLFRSACSVGRTRISFAVAIAVARCCILYMSRYDGGISLVSGIGLELGVASPLHSTPR